MPAFDFVLAGRYRLIAPLGEGGMAVVYRARDLRLNREVAVKVLHEDLTRDPEFLRRFEREAQIVASLSHPHIVPVYDVGDESGAHFIVMEYVRGRTLKQAIDQEGPLQPDRAVDIMLQVVDALGYAHRQGLVHRDIKPQNILLTGESEARLADFGIVHQVDGSTTRTAAILGSAQYLSPEQSRGEEATERSDIYACGIVLYEMLAGAPPFEGANALAVANQHLHTPPPPLQAQVPGLGRPVDDAVARALAKNPADRFPDATAFGAALQSGRSALDQTEVMPQLPAVRHRQAESGSRPALSTEGAALVVRRSARKSYLLAAALTLVVAVTARVASAPFWGSSLPQYPSAPYALLPAALACLVVISWLRSRSWIYTLDAHVAVAQWGLVAHHRIGVPLHQITTLELRQSPLERLLSVGTVELLARDARGTERRLVLEDVPRPRQTYEELMRVVAQSGRQPRRHEAELEPE